MERRGERGRGLRPSAAALDEAVAAIHPYPRWVATTGAAGLAGALALLLDSPWVAVLAAAAVTAVIDVTGRYLAKRRLPAFFRQVVGGSWQPGRPRRCSCKVPPLVVALAGISPLLPGLTAYRGFYQLSVEGLTDGLVTIKPWHWRSAWRSRRGHARAVPHPARGDPAVALGSGAARRAGLGFTS